MEDANLDWMNEGPLALSGVMHKMKWHVEKLLTKYDPDKIVKVEDRLDNFYLHLLTLEVCYDGDPCRHFHVPWMVEHLYDIISFLQTPCIIRGHSKGSSLRNLLKIKPLPCYWRSWVVSTSSRMKRPNISIRGSTIFCTSSRMIQSLMTPSLSTTTLLPSQPVLCNLLSEMWNQL